MIIRPNVLPVKQGSMPGGVILIVGTVGMDRTRLPHPQIVSIVLQGGMSYQVAPDA